MKNLVLIFLICGSSTAFAFGPENRWEEIFQIPDLVIYHREDLGRIDMQNACLSSTKIKTIHDVTVCLKLKSVKKGLHGKDGWTDWECEVQGLGQIIQPRNGIARTIGVKVGRGQGNTMMGPSFWKAYTFPGCEMFQFESQPEAVPDLNGQL
jgi:hypothetical protein